MRPAGPVPATWRRSMPASRARSRTAGEASGFSPAGARRTGRRLAGARASWRGVAAAGFGAGSAAARPASSAGAAAGLRRLGCAGFGSWRARPWPAAALPSPATFEPHDRRADRHRLADLGAEPQDLAVDRRRDLDRRLVGHHGGEQLVLAHEVADLDVPFDELGLGDAFADIGQLDDVLAHLTPPSSRVSARPTRAGPGK